MYFKNRNEAGELLARKIQAIHSIVKDAIVFSFSDSAALVANEISNKLNLQSERFVFRKITAPLNPELTIGIVSEDGDVVYNKHLLDTLGYCPLDIEPLKTEALNIILETMERRNLQRASLSIIDKNVILVDDGIVTGATIESVVLLLRRKGVRNLIIATPMASVEAVMRLENIVEEFIALHVLHVIGHPWQYFAEFSNELNL
jgi:predicted phosphoribosyltransferase